MASSGNRSETDQISAASELKGVLGDSRMVAYGTLVSRITGFGRVATAAAVLGPTFFGNLFQTAAILPSSLYSLLIGAMISAVLVPPLVRRRDTGGRDEVRRLADTAAGTLLTLLLCVGLITVVAAPVLLRVLTITVTSPEVRREQLNVGVPLLGMLMPQIALYGIAGVGMAVQQAHGHFALPAIAPALENFANIAVLAAAAFFFGVGTDVSQVSLPQLLLLGLGTTAAVAVHAGTQWIGAYRLGVPILPRFHWRDPDLWQVVCRGASSMGYSALYWASYLIIFVIGGTVPGGVAAFQLAVFFCLFPVALTALPLATAQLPSLSTRHERQEMQAFGRIYESGLRLLTFTTAPAALMAVTLPGVLAGAGAFGAMDAPSGISLIADCLGGLGLGMIGEAVFIFTSSACYALDDTTGPCYAMAMRLVLGGTLAILVRLTMPSGHEMIWMVGASLAAGNVVAGTYLCCRLRSILPPEVVESSGLVSALAISAAASIPALLLVYRWDASTHMVSYKRVGFALAIVGLTIAVYLVIQLLRGSREIFLLIPAFRRPWRVRPRVARM